ncbi:beta-phosphoglucomutase [uncultured Cetobacterium sp.]|uniref:beta-phosphoglucomutase n=1 Tax=uncultured Cetobacterium sp. TaxID=527638 RepID=UPI0025E2F072|nr:beta-phosphoglucomutase [uncultured Cetobacterium sp.]
MIKGFVFDLDGVITDTAEYHYLAWKKLADDNNWKFTREINEKLRGVSRLDSLQIILDYNEVDLSFEEKNRLANLKNTNYINSLGSITPKDLLPGVKEFLTELRDKGYKTSIASASKNANLVLTRLEAKDLFDNISDGNSVENSKPAPDVFIHAAGSIGCRAKECVVLEDAAAGVEAGKIAGMKVIGLGSIETLGAADVVFKGMYEIDLDFVIKKLTK